MRVRVVVTHNDGVCFVNVGLAYCWARSSLAGNLSNILLAEVIVDWLFDWHTIGRGHR